MKEHDYWTGGLRKNEKYLPEREWYCKVWNILEDELWGLNRNIQVLMCNGDQLVEIILAEKQREQEKNILKINFTLMFANNNLYALEH